MQRIEQSLLPAFVGLLLSIAVNAADEPAKENQSAVAQVESGQSLPTSVAVNVHLTAIATQHKVWPGSSSTWPLLRILRSRH